MAEFIGVSIGSWLAYSTFNIIIGWLVITAGYVALAFYAAGSGASSDLARRDMASITFRVDGVPVPKQSYRHSKSGDYQLARVKAWQNDIAWCAKEVMRVLPPMDGDLVVTLEFILPTRRRQDCVNLAKPVEDAMNGVVYVDDAQVVDLHITKRVGDQPGVTVTVTEYDLYKCDDVW